MGDEQERYRQLIKNAIHKLRIKRFKWGIPEGEIVHYTNFQNRYSAVGTIVKETTGCSDIDIAHNVNQVLPEAIAEIIQALDSEGFTWEEIADFLETFNVGEIK